LIDIWSLIYVPTFAMKVRSLIENQVEDWNINLLLSESCFENDTSVKVKNRNVHRDYQPDFRLYRTIRDLWIIKEYNSCFGSGNDINIHF
jgi:hypothetical protein